MPTTIQTDADGTWTVTSFANGIKERQLTTPSAAYLAAQAAAAALPQPASDHQRLVSLLQDIAQAVTIADLKTRIATDPILQGP